MRQLRAHIHDTHVLIDERGTAVLSGSKEQMEDEEAALRAVGVRNIEVRTIDLQGNWDWTSVDWGD